MKKPSHLISFLILSIFSMEVAAATPGAMEIVDSAMRDAITATVATIQTQAILWLSSFVLIQFLITQLGLLKSGADFDAIFVKLTGSVMWFGFCFYVLTNGSKFIGGVSLQFVDIAGSISGIGQFSASYILDWGVNLGSSLLSAVDAAKGGGILAKLDFLPSMLAGVSALFILATAALIGFKIFLVKIEIALVVMMSPLSFSFLGLNALKDQGIAPFKALISLIYRVILLGVICKTMSSVGDSLLSVFSSVSSGSITEIWNPIFAALFGYFLLGFLAFKSDSIASSLASGSTNMGTGDVASAAAMGAAMGAVAGTGGAAALGAAAKAPQSMGSFLGGLANSGSAISNASGRGTGQTPSQAPSRAASMSTAPAAQGGGAASGASSGGASGGAPSASSSSGAPARQAIAGVAPGSTGAAPSAYGSAKSTDSAGVGADSGGGGDQKTTAPASEHGPGQTGRNDDSVAGQAPVRSASGTEAGNGENAGIAAPLEQKLDKLADALLRQAQQGSAPRKTSMRESLSELNKHIAQEKATTGASINIHHSD